MKEGMGITTTVRIELTVIIEKKITSDSLFNTKKDAVKHIIDSTSLDSFRLTIDDDIKIKDIRLID